MEISCSAIAMKYIAEYRFLVEMNPSDLVPAGHFENSPAFQRRGKIPYRQSPAGTAEWIPCPTLVFILRMTFQEGFLVPHCGI
jgi:hypothetical protein